MTFAAHAQAPSDDALNREPIDSGIADVELSDEQRYLETLEWAQEIVRFAVRAADHNSDEAAETALMSTSTPEDRRAALNRAARDALDDAEQDALDIAETMFGDEYWTPGALPAESDRFPEESLYWELGAFDLSTVRPIFSQRRFLPEFDPDGKTVCNIHYATRDVFVPEEPFPTWLNGVHATTKVATAAIAFQLEVGEIYSEERIWETAEDLRNPLVYSTVVVLPVSSMDEGCVDVLVVTRDIWSLRAGWDLDYSGGVLRELGIRFVETNLAGLNDTIGLSFLLSQGSWGLGPVWQADWIGGRNLFAQVELSAIFDRETGGFDGTAGILNFRQPIRTVDDSEGWEFSTQHRVATERNYIGRELRTETVADPVTGENFEIQRRWYETYLKSRVTRSWAFGVDNRHILHAGAFMDLVDVDARPMDASVTEGALDEFTQKFLPRQERGLGPLFQYVFFQRKFIERVNYREFERTERYRRGFEARADIRYSEPYVGASDRFLSALALVAFREGFGSDGLIELAALQSVRFQSPITDIRTEGVLRIATPSGLAGRFVDRVFVRRWARNEENEFYELSEQNAVRGLGGDSIEGSNAFVQNLEWRSRAVDIFSIRVGVAVFNDIGASWDPGEAPEWRSSVGFGLRLFAPQFMATVASLDIGFEIGREDNLSLGNWALPVAAPSISIRFGQLFGGATVLTRESLEF